VSTGSDYVIRLANSQHLLVIEVRMCPPGPIFITTGTLAPLDYRGAEITVSTSRLFNIINAKNATVSKCR